MSLGQPSLDRLPSQKYPVKVFQILPDCDVCGHRVNAQFLKDWNDKKVCRKCIDELEGEYERSIAPTSNSAAGTN